MQIESQKVKNTISYYVQDVLHDRKIWIRTKQFCGRVKKKKSLAV
jgi:hypothetical protein